MWAALIPLISTIITPIKDYFSYKQKLSESSRDLELARIQAEKEAIISGNQAEISRTQSYLNATSRTFRQGTFYFFMVPFIISMVAPDYAKIMWDNFGAIPQEFKLLFFSIYGVIWGLPIAKENIGQMFSSVGRALETRREFKLEKARINREVAFNIIRAKMFPKGMNQSQVDAFEEAFNAGEKS